MQSTINSDFLLQAQAINLVFNTNLYRGWTWRDAFVDFARSGSLLGKQDRLHVVQNIDLEVRRGDRIGILGTNGAGKTSLCRCLAGYYRPTSGTIRTNGDVRAVFDTNIGLHQDLTGRENLRLLARFMFPKERHRIQEIVNEAADFSELKEFLDAPYRIYSNGMRMRLSLSLITAMPSPILILDEVYDGADQFFREKSTKRVKKIIEDSGAVLFVSHVESQVEDVCNRVIVIKGGQKLFDGDVKTGLQFYKEISLPNFTK